MAKRKAKPRKKVEEPEVKAEGPEVEDVQPEPEPEVEEVQPEVEEAEVKAEVKAEEPPCLYPTGPDKTRCFNPSRFVMIKGKPRRRCDYCGQVKPDTGVV